MLACFDNRLEFAIFSALVPNDQAPRGLEKIGSQQPGSKRQFHQRRGSQSLMSRHKRLKTHKQEASSCFAWQLNSDHIEERSNEGQLSGGNRVSGRSLESRLYGSHRGLLRKKEDIWDPHAICIDSKEMVRQQYENRYGAESEERFWEIRQSSVILWHCRNRGNATYGSFQISVPCHCCLGSTQTRQLPDI